MKSNNNAKQSKYSMLRMRLEHIMEIKRPFFPLLVMAILQY
ncbi:MAG: hypothetical protein ACLPWD_05400 [Methanobacterium sp.]